MRMSKRSFVFGLGAGLLVASAVFFSAYSSVQKVSATPVQEEISDEEVIERARTLGMVAIDEVSTATPVPSEISEEWIVEQAQKLGMSFQEETDLETDSELEALIKLNEALETIQDTEEPVAEAEPIAEAADEPPPPTHSPEPIAVRTAEPNATSVVVTIQRGAKAYQVAQLLYNNGVIDNAYTFTKHLGDNGWAQYVKAGTYRFTKGSNYETLVKTIVGKVPATPTEAPLETEETTSEIEEVPSETEEAPLEIEEESIVTDQPVVEPNVMPNTE